MSPHQDQSTGLGTSRVAIASPLVSIPRSDGALPTGEGEQRRLAWAAPAGGAWTRLDVAAGVCVVVVAGVLDAGALQPCRAALDAASALRPDRVVIDLGSTVDSGPVTVVLLAAARRYLRHRRMAMTLTAVPASVLRALEEAHVAALYDIQATTAIAIANAQVTATPRGPARVPVFAAAAS